MNNLRRWCCLVGIVAASGLNACSQDVTRGQRVTCEKYGFSMAVPRGWSAGLIDMTTPMFINFDPRTAPVPTPPIQLPKGGATIGVLASDLEPGAKSSPEWLKTPRGWAAEVARREGLLENPIITPIDFPRESGVSNAVTTAFDDPTYSPGEQHQRCVNIFWEFGGRLFRAHLTYVKEDPRGAAHEKVFQDTIRTIRPLRK